MIKAIETRYKGYRFRSRTEARWAVFFDAEGIAWEYEKEGFNLPSGPYLPDFWLPQVEMWAEVKGKTFTEIEIRKCNELAIGSGFPCLFLEGPPACAAYWACHPNDPYWMNDDNDQGPHWMDYVIDSSYLHENRFYSHSGECGNPTAPMPLEYYGLGEKSVASALSARFEHGERP